MFGPSSQSPLSSAGDVKEFGFRPIPEDGNYASHFSGETPSGADPKDDADQKRDLNSSPAESDSDLIDLGKGGSQGPRQDDKEAVKAAIHEADRAVEQQRDESMLAPHHTCLISLPLIPKPVPTCHPLVNTNILTLFVWKHASTTLAYILCRIFRFYW